MLDIFNNTGEIAWCVQRTWLAIYRYWVQFSAAHSISRYLWYVKAIYLQRFFVGVTSWPDHLSRTRNTQYVVTLSYLGGRKHETSPAIGYSTLKWKSCTIEFLSTSSVYLKFFFHIIFSRQCCEEVSEIRACLIHLQWFKSTSLIDTHPL